MIENYEAIREAIARWMGWQSLGRGWRHPSGLICESPDPLNNDWDAWALQCAVMKRYDVAYLMMSAGGHMCRFSTGFSEQAHYEAVGKTPAEALVRAWVAAFGGEAWEAQHGVES